MSSSTSVLRRRGGGGEQLIKNVLKEVVLVAKRVVKKFVYFVSGRDFANAYLAVVLAKVVDGHGKRWIDDGLI